MDLEAARVLVRDERLEGLAAVICFHAHHLNIYCIPSRYPAEVGGPAGPITAREAAEALAWAEEIAAAVRPHLRLES